MIDAIIQVISAFLELILRESKYPRVRVLCQIKHLTFPGPSKETKLIISAINPGPNKIQITSIIAKRSFIKSNLFKKPYIEKLLPDTRLSGFYAILPGTVDVQERVNWVLDLSVLTNDYSTIGLLDILNRKHWMPKKTYKKVKREFEKTFRAGSEPQRST